MINPTSSLARAGQWLLHSGIQSPEGGVARYYRSDLHKNNPVSTEITGYHASTLAYLYGKTGESVYAERALHTARFLVRHGWDRNLRTFPFEWPEPSDAYFFDCGIIVRGLLKVWRMSAEDEFLDAAVQGACAMFRDFDSGADYHPILELPSRRPAPRDARWSRSSGCYQLKAALGWLDLSAVTGDSQYRTHFDRLLDIADRDDAAFLPGAADEDRVMDRLHAYCYYLEALTALGRDITAGIDRVSGYLQSIGPRFARSDVYAQLLRLRLASGTKVAEGCAELNELRKYQAASQEARIDGGFYFGTRGGCFLPDVNPVSTSFALQAMQMWTEQQSGALAWDYRDLI